MRRGTRLPVSWARPLLHAGSILVLGAVCPGPAAADTGTGAKTFDVTQVAPGLYVHQGQHVNIDDPDRDDIANIGFIVGEKCVAVVDTGGSVAVGAALLATIRASTDKPICYVVNTHGHYDHVLGNAAFKDLPEVEFAGHANLAAGLSASTELFLRQFGADLGPNPGPDKIVAPALQVRDRREIDLGNRVLDLRAHPLAHTDSDLTLLDRNTGTLWLGDLLFMDRIPVLDGSLPGWMEELRRLQEVTASRVIPGHGPASAPWPDAAAPEAAYLQNLRDEVRAGIAAGQFMEDLMETAGQAEKSKWLLHESNHARNVGRAFTELEWE
ncbi:MAG: quinoprotein relay system zinc metallohydrolase 2 [Gammaproteobacteria bacterium]|nr:quinoprotein relay system zinc metallohydrolase 2 [Gammaproteobacteria bacterium]